MCRMVFAIQGKTENYVRLEKDGLGIEFLGKGTKRHCIVVVELFECHP